MDEDPRGEAFAEAIRDAVKAARAGKDPARRSEAVKPYKTANPPVTLNAEDQRMLKELHELQVWELLARRDLQALDLYLFAELVRYRRSFLDALTDDLMDTVAADANPISIATREEDLAVYREITLRMFR